MTNHTAAPLLLAASILLTSTAWAQSFQWDRSLVAGPINLSVVEAERQRPAPPSDPRVRSVMFQENDVVRVDTKLRFITAIEFATGETVRAVLAGDTKSFEIVRLKSGNVISIKPLVRRARTNVNIYTDRRTYVLDVREGRRKRLTHRVRFDYPPPPPDQAQLIAAGAIPGPEIARDYSAAGTADFRPIEAWDDGTATYFQFSKNARRPAIFWSDETGADYATNTTQIDGNTVKVNLIRDRWTFRIGNQVVCVVKGAISPALTVALAEAQETQQTNPSIGGSTHAQR
ncbi:MAG: TrbG/VirB9 family P-type conjugative transfer protein [Pseudomonadota bacterium]